ncbi:MAG: hypothetical protein LKI58_00035 [Actinomyces sp.]|jgi:hypothetical protein|nr:hypothetical protein [Actinomyces sp.]MCI1786447.1 hypothetical protein [Actinomyces sp.]
MGSPARFAPSGRCPQVLEGIDESDHVVGVGLLVGSDQFLVDGPGDGHLPVRVAFLEESIQLGRHLLTEVVDPGEEESSSPIQGVLGVSPAPESVVLDSTTHLIEGPAGQLCHVEDVDDHVRFLQGR